MITDKKYSDENSAIKSVAVTSYDALARLEYLRYRKQENFICITFDAAWQVIKRHHVYKGTQTSMAVHPNDIFRHAIKDCAVSIVVAHNHPSGNPSPSDADISATQQIVAAGQILGIIVTDHIIVGKAGSFSFASHGLMLPAHELMQHAQLLK